MENQKEYKEKNLLNGKEVDMAKNKAKRSYSGYSTNIDGCGVILVIIGLAIYLLKPEMQRLGSFISLMGTIWIIYVYIKYGKG